MPFRLLTCDDGVVSLEFEPGDMDELRAAIMRQFGGLNDERHVVSSDVHFGGESFTFQNEWDDPCLITSTESGRTILRRLYADLKAIEAQRNRRSSSERR
jgi:hypothetical protein